MDKPTVTLLVHLTEKDDKVFVTVEGDSYSMLYFGITAHQFHELGLKIENAIQDVLSIKSEIPECKF